MKYAVSRMKMPHVRDCAIVVISTNLKRHVCYYLMGFLSCSSDKLSLCIGAWGMNFSFLSYKVRAKSKTVPL